MLVKKVCYLRGIYFAVRKKTSKNIATIKYSNYEDKPVKGSLQTPNIVN